MSRSVLLVFCPLNGGENGIRAGISILKPEQEIALFGPRKLVSRTAYRNPDETKV